MREAVGDKTAEGIRITWLCPSGKVISKGGRESCKTKVIDKLMHFAKLQKVAIKKQNVYKLFDVLQGTATVNSIQHINMHLTEDQKKLSTTKWKGEKLGPVVDQAQSLAVAL